MFDNLEVFDNGDDIDTCGKCSIDPNTGAGYWWMFSSERDVDDGRPMIGRAPGRNSNED